MMMPLLAATSGTLAPTIHFDSSHYEAILQSLFAQELYTTDFASLLAAV